MNETWCLDETNLNRKSTMFLRIDTAEEPILSGCDSMISESRELLIRPTAIGNSMVLRSNNPTKVSTKQSSLNPSV